MWWWVSMRPDVISSPERGQAGACDLLVLARLHARDPNPADAFALVDDRQGALEQRAGGKIGEGGPLLDAVLPELGRLPGERRGFRFVGRDDRRDRRGAVHAFETEQSAAIVDDRDRDVPAVAFRFGEAGGHH